MKFKFTSHLEKQLWLIIIVIVLVIFSSLFIGNPLLQYLGNQNVRAVFFVLGMLLVGLAVLFYVFSPKTKMEVGLIIGLTAIYVMFILRLGMAERSHLIEYTVLTLFIHKAFLERSIHIKPKIHPLLTTFLVAGCIGLIDESIQYFLPKRVFDYYDIAFNLMAIGFALVVIFVFSLIRKKVKRNQ